MPNPHKAEILATLRAKFGELRKLKGSESLFRLGEDAARIYIRYSKVHSDGAAFFGIRELDLRQLEGYNSFLCFLVDDGSAPIGHLKRYEVYVPECDAGRLDWTLTERFALRGSAPSGFEQARGILSEIDVIWVARGGEAIEGLFEVEHTTTVYSGLLRFNDIHLTDPKVSRFSIVSHDSRRGLFARQLFRPTFRKSGLAELTSFPEYSNVVDWHMRLAKGNANEQARLAD